MGLAAVPTTSAFYDNAVVDAERASAPRARAADRVQRAGRRPAGHRRGGAVGIAQAALDEACAYANERTTFGRKIIDHQGWASCWPTWPPR